MKNPNFKNEKFQILKMKNFKIFISNFRDKFQKCFFSKIFISGFPYDMNKFFSYPEVAKSIKRLQKLPIYPYQK
jgi:hypothetical protein